MLLPTSTSSSGQLTTSFPRTTAMSQEGGKATEVVHRGVSDTASINTAKANTLMSLVEETPPNE